MTHDFWEELKHTTLKRISHKIRPIRSWEFSAYGRQKHNFCKLSDAFNAGGLGLIAEYCPLFFYKDPELFSYVDPQEWARRMINCNVEALSVITEPHYFKGKTEDLWSIHDLLSTRLKAPPVICKDLILSPIQILEALEGGTAAITLFPKVLEYDTLMPLLECCYEAGIEYVFEVHDEFDLETAVEIETEIISISAKNASGNNINWDLITKLIKNAPNAALKLIAGGINDASEAKRIAKLHFDGIFVSRLTLEYTDESELERQLVALRCK